MQPHQFEGKEYDIDELSKKKWADLTEDEQMAIEDFHAKRESKQYEESCQSCDLFVKEFFGDRYEPPEPAYCWHPKVDNITNINPNFPFKNGCKHKIRGVINEPSYWLKLARHDGKCSFKGCTEDAKYYEVRPNQGLHVCEKHRTVSLEKLDTTDVDQLLNLELFCTVCGLHDKGWERLTKYQFRCPNPNCNEIIRHEHKHNTEKTKKELGG